MGKTRTDVAWPRRHASYNAYLMKIIQSCCKLLGYTVSHICIDDDDDDEGRINFSVALSPKTTRTRNNKPKQ